MLLWNPFSKWYESMDRDRIKYRSEIERIKYCSDIERMKWYNLLLLYGTNDEEVCSSDKMKHDPDRNLMSHLIEKVVLLKLKGNHHHLNMHSLNFITL